MMIGWDCRLRHRSSERTNNLLKISLFIHLNNERASGQRVLRITPPPPPRRFLL